jgi:hypothetical protein
MAIVEILLVFGCYFCGKQSLESDAAEVKKENDLYVQ